jgi:hypothetical protein
MHLIQNMDTPEPFFRNRSPNGRRDRPHSGFSDVEWNAVRERARTELYPELHPMLIGSCVAQSRLSYRSKCQPNTR